MTVSLTPELEKLVQAEIESGRFHSANEVVEEALRLLERREVELKEFRARIDNSIAEADRGEMVDGEEFMQKMLDDLDLQEADRRVG